MGEKKATKLNAEAFPCCVFHFFPGSSISYDKNNRPWKQEREKKKFSFGGKNSRWGNFLIFFLQLLSQHICGACKQTLQETKNIPEPFID